MKTYGILEAIKMLTENPKLKFEYDTGCEKGVIANILGNIELIECNNKPCSEYLTLHRGFMTQAWTLVEEPVDFWTAFEAWKNEGKRITSATTGESVEGIFRNDVIFTSREIKGKWYIQEDENNE